MKHTQVLAIVVGMEEAGDANISQPWHRLPRQPDKARVTSTKKQQVEMQHVSHAALADGFEELGSDWEWQLHPLVTGTMEAADTHSHHMTKAPHE